MSTVEWAGCLLVLALAAFAQGVFGLGFAMIATPLLALFLDYPAAVFLAAAPLWVMALYWLARNRAVMRGTPVPRLLVPALVAGAAAGVWTQIALPQRVALAWLAGMLAFALCLPWALRAARADVAAPARRATPVFGLLAGLTESALNVGAPFMLLFGGLARLGRLEQLLALNLCFFVGKSVQLGLLLAVSAAPVAPGPALAGVVVALLCYRTGDRLAGRHGEAHLRRWFAAFLALIVGALLVRVALLAP